MPDDLIVGFHIRCFSELILCSAHGVLGSLESEPLALGVASCVSLLVSTLVLTVSSTHRRVTAFAEWTLLVTPRLAQAAISLCSSRATRHSLYTYTQPLRRKHGNNANPIGPRNTIVVLLLIHDHAGDTVLSRRQAFGNETRTPDTDILPESLQLDSFVFGIVRPAFHVAQGQRPTPQVV